MKTEREYGEELKGLRGDAFQTLFVEYLESYPDRRDKERFPLCDRCGKPMTHVQITYKGKRVHRYSGCATCGRQH